MFDFPILFPSIIIFAAFFTRALTGFGAALISVPLLVFFFDLKFIIPLVLIFDLAIGILLLRPVWKSIELKHVGPLIAGQLCGNILGAYILAHYPNETLKIVLAIFILAFSIYLAKTAKEPISLNISPSWGVPMGLVGGVFGGLFGMSGPLVVLYLVHQIKEKEAMRATLVFVFFIPCVWKTFLYSYNGLFTFDMIEVALALTPAFLIATFLGYRTHYKVSETTFRIILAVILFVSSLLLFKNAL